MAVFTYRASGAAADQNSGTIAADTPRQARDLLRQRGLVVFEVESLQPAVTRRRRLTWRRGQSHQTTMFIRELATLLGVGVPLLEALGTLSSQYHAAFASTIVLLRDRVAAGMSLAQAIRE